jgi:hypothetical protein
MVALELCCQLIVAQITCLTNSTELCRGLIRFYKNATGPPILSPPPLSVFEKLFAATLVGHCGILVALNKNYIFRPKKGAEKHSNFTGK